AAAAAGFLWTRLAWAAGLTSSPATTRGRRRTFIYDSRLGVEAVSGAAHRDEVARAIRVALELGAQLGHEVVDGAPRAGADSPDLAQEPLARVDLARIAHEVAEQLELEVGELDRLALAGDDAGGQVDDDVAEAAHVAGGGLAAADRRAAQHRGD